jgi:thiosulfate dehydrogenase
MSKRSDEMRVLPVLGLVCVCVAARAEAPPQAASLDDAAQQGASLFTHESFGGSGTCEACHLSGGRTQGQLPDGKAIPSLVGAAAHYPKYASRAHAVITLPQQIHNCIAGALQGTPPAFGSPQMVYLETYLVSLSKGTPLGEATQK